jgi:DNA-binding HxlR family transcriptional regulator
MELELMFAEQKWNILKCLSEGKYSPLQLAEKLNTTMANISQQLRLLEAANLVKKEKIKNRDKGKPRTLFSLNEDVAYLIPAMHNFANKKLLRVNDYHKMVLKIWFLENPELHPHIEKLYWKIEPYLSQIRAIVVKQSSRELFIITDKSAEIERIADKSKAINIKVFSPEEAEKAIKNRKEPFSSVSELSIVYDNNNILSKNPTEVIPK